MGDIVQLHDRFRKRWAADGETTFMLCACGAESGLLPVVLHDAGAPLIVALVCPECEQEASVVNGRVGEPAPRSPA